MRTGQEIKPPECSYVGGCPTLGRNLLKGLSKTRTAIGLSSEESEVYCTVKAVSEGLGMISIAKDVGIQLAGEFWGDASAVLGIIKRRGLGKTRRIDIGLNTWLLSTVRSISETMCHNPEAFARFLRFIYSAPRLISEQFAPRVTSIAYSMLTRILCIGLP